MRAAFPVFLMIIGIGASNFAFRRLPGGLANADRYDIVYLAQSAAISCYDHAPSQVQHFLQNVFSNSGAGREMRSMHRRRHRHFQRYVHSSHGETIQTRIRIGDEQVSVYHRERPARRRDRDQGNRRLRGSEPDLSVEILFVAPAEKLNDSEAQRRGRRARRR